MNEAVPLLTHNGPKKNHWNRLTQKTMLVRVLTVIGLLITLIGGVWLLQMLLQNDPKDVSQNWNKDMHAIRTYSQHCADNIHMVAPQDFVKRHENLARTLQNDDDAFAYVMEPSATMLYFANIGWSRTERPFVIIYSLDDTSATGVAMTIVTPMFEATRAQEQLIKAKLPSDVPVEVVTWIEHESPYETILSVLESKQRRAGQSKTKVYVEATTRLFVAKGISDAIPASSSLATAVASQAIQQLRMVKTPVEVDLMRCAARVTHFAVQKVHPYVKPGLKESEVAAMMTEALAHGGLEETWVVALVDENAALPHGNPAHENVVQPGSLILIDTGGSFYGYQSDLTRTFFAAGDADHTIKTNQTLLDAWQSVKNAQQAVIDTMKKGNSCAQVDLTARHIIENAGFGPYFTHRLGHGIGLEMHEDPYMNQGNVDCHLLPGFTFSVEPGVYVPHEFGIRLEDIVVVNEQGDIETLSQVADDPWNP